MFFKKSFTLLALSGVLATTAFAANKDKNAPAKLDVDTAATKIKWTGKKVTGEHWGHIPVKSGTVELKGDKLVGGEFLIDVAALTVDDIADKESNGKLVGHLKSDDFFATEKNPTAKFVVTKVQEKTGKNGETHSITGNLSIKGKTHPVTFPATVASKDGIVTAAADIEVDRTKWDIKYGSGKFFQSLGDKVINDQFLLSLNLKTK